MADGGSTDGADKGMMIFERDLGQGFGLNYPFGMADVLRVLGEQKHRLAKALQAARTFAETLEADPKVVLLALLKTVEDTHKDVMKVADLKTDAMMSDGLATLDSL